MELVKIRFSSEEDHNRGTAGLAQRMEFVSLRGGFLVIPVVVLSWLDEWGCQYEIVARAGLRAA